MKKILHFIRKNILVDTIIYMLFIIILYFVLKLFNLQYRNWIYYVSFIILMIGTIIGIVQLYRRKGKIFKRSIIALVLIIALVCLAFWPYILLLIVFSYTPEHEVIKDDEKYIAHVHYWLDTTVDYYEYVNLFFMGDKKRISEEYYNVGRDVLDKDVEGKFTPAETTYYDENGKAIREK